MPTQLMSLDPDPTPVLVSTAPKILNTRVQNICTSEVVIDIGQNRRYQRIPSSSTRKSDSNGLFNSCQ